MSEPIDPQSADPSRPLPDQPAPESASNPDTCGETQPAPSLEPNTGPVARPPFSMTAVHLAANRLLLPGTASNPSCESPEIAGESPAEDGSRNCQTLSPSGSQPAPRLIRVPVGCPPDVREDIETVVSDLHSFDLTGLDFMPMEAGLGRERFEQAVARRRWEMEEWEDWEDGEGPETIGVDGAPFCWGSLESVTLVEEDHPLYPFAPYVLGMFFGGFGGVFSWYRPDGTVFACVLSGFGTPVPTFDSETGWSVVLEIDEYGDVCFNGTIYAAPEAAQVLAGALQPDVPGATDA